MVEYYQLADFFVLPSCCEAANVSIAEAAGCNLPFITYQTGTWYHTPPTGAGLVAQDWTTKEFAKLVQVMVTIVTEGKRVKPREVVKPIYGLPTWKESWSDLLRFILE
jgi:glycosyltransferase involved in cell wall biosynthesis